VNYFYEFLFVVQCQLVKHLIILHLLFYRLEYTLTLIFKDETV